MTAQQEYDARKIIERVVLLQPDDEHRKGSGVVMRVLVACEFSGVVRDAFLAEGHDALSCDLLPSERPGPHYQGDVRDVLDASWHLLIAHPPCTYLSKANTWRWPTTQAELARDSAFFLALWQAPIPHIAVENPPGWINSHVCRPTQTVQPWQFGDPYTKATSLWLKGLPALHATTCVTPVKRYIVDMPHTRQRSRLRSITPSGMAKAMAQQWGAIV